MNWSALGALGELLSAIAVLVTLIYLALQIKQSNRLMLAQHRETNRVAMMSISLPVIQDPDFADLIESTREGVTGLSAGQLRRVKDQLRNELLNAQSIYVRAKLMDEERTMTVGVMLAANLITSHVVAKELWENISWEDEFEETVTQMTSHVDTQHAPRVVP